MLSRSPSDRPSSTDGRPSARYRAGQFAGLAVLCVAVTALGLAAARRTFSGELALLATGIGCVLVLGLIGVVALRRDAARLRASERWQRRLRGELRSQSAFLDALVTSLGAISSSLDGARVFESTTAQAQTLLDADVTVLMVPDADARRLRPAAARGVALGPMSGLAVELDDRSSVTAEAARSRTAAAADLGGTGDGDPLMAHVRPHAVLAAPLVVMGEVQAVLVAARVEAGDRFGPGDLTRAAVLADFAARAAENALLFQRVEALLAQARIREAERAELSRRVVSAEQDERRKLSLELHDGPLQTLSGVGMMLDAAYEDISAAGVGDPALDVLDIARDRQRGVIRSLRELCFALEPWVLRDEGFVTAVKALADEFERNHAVRLDLDVDAAAALSGDDQVCLYQIVREAVTNAVKHARPQRIEVSVTGTEGGGLELRVHDDGAGFTDGPDDGLPHHGMASMRERAAVLSAQLRVDSVPGEGTTVRVTMPRKVADVA
jgi:signal transduction histidine kinase